MIARAVYRGHYIVRLGRPVPFSADLQGFYFPSGRVLSARGLPGEHGVYRGRGQRMGQQGSTDGSTVRLDPGIPRNRKNPAVAGNLHSAEPPGIPLTTTRNEGVPGSSPGVGSRDSALRPARWQRWWQQEPPPSGRAPPIGGIIHRRPRCARQPSISGPTSGPPLVHPA